ncbi:MAG: hypothetical protein O3B95_08600 [Chloroflexi bacterium]|nr:hypothetical protein [Chloroflexota bacterium]
MRPRHVLTGVIALLLLMVIVACGAGEGEAGGGTTVDEVEPVQILQSGRVFTVDDVVAAGWKNSKELSAETLPGASSVWYGFFQRRDVEVRVYESHESAIASGMGPADVATGRGKPAPFAVGGISATRTSYVTYAIVGNLILTL